MLFSLIKARTGVLFVNLNNDYSIVLSEQFKNHFKAGGSELKQGYYCTHWSRQDSSTPSLEYLAHRQNKKEVWAAEILAVDAVNLLAHAIRQAGTATDRSKIRQNLSEVQDFQGISGSIYFDKNGDPIKDVIIMKIHNGSPLFYSRFKPDQDEATP